MSKWYTNTFDISVDPKQCRIFEIIELNNADFVNSTRLIYG